MTSIYRQQRFSAFATGVVSAVGIYVYSKTHLLQVTQDAAQQLPGSVQRPVLLEEQVAEPMLGATARAWAVRKWNEGVDAVFKPVVQALSRRNL